MSYVRAPAAPGEADWQVRSVEWIRDHGGGPVVDMVENWWYAHNQPTGSAPAAGTVPTDGRSGLGTDRTGDLVYVAGDQLSLSELADAMVAAGVQRGMELDIHPKTVTFTTFRPAAGQPFGLAATKLLPGMVQPATRYLVQDHRDFLAVALRAPGR